MAEPTAVVVRWSEERSAGSWPSLVGAVVIRLGKMRGALLAGLPARDRNDVVQGLAAARRKQTQVRLSQADGRLDGTGQRPRQRAVPRSAERLQAAAEAQQQLAVELSKAAQRQPADRSARRRAMLAWKVCEQRWQTLHRLQHREIITVRPR